MAAPFATVLNFHGVGPVTRALDPGEAAYWLDAPRFEAIVDFVAARPDRDRILITIDDGNKSDLTIAAPKLRAAGLRTKIFALAGRLGREGSLDAEDLRTLRAQGFEIGSHGRDHVDWRRLDARGLQRELEEAKATLEAVLGAPVTGAAVPFGRYDRRVLAALRQAGFGSIYTSDGGPAGPGPIFARTSLRAVATPEDAAAILDDRVSALRRLRRRAGALRKRLI